MNQDINDNEGDVPEQRNDASGEQVERASGDAADEPREAAGDEGGGRDEELARMKDALLRLRAEMDNQEKRAEREMAKSRKFALEALMRDLIQVLDSLDQAVANAGDEAEEGVALTRKLALKVLEQHGMEIVDPAGQPFDPSWHEAIATQPSEDVESDTVVSVLQTGYRLHDRLLRPARVVVARPPSD